MARQGNVRTMTIGTSATLFLPARRNRVALLLFPSHTATGDITISNDPSVSAGNGIFLPASGTAGTIPLCLDENNSGDLVTQPLYAFCSVASTVIAFVETIDSDR